MLMFIAYLVWFILPPALLIRIPRRGIDQHIKFAKEWQWQIAAAYVGCYLFLFGALILNVLGTGVAQLFIDPDTGVNLFAGWDSPTNAFVFFNFEQKHWWNSSLGALAVLMPFGFILDGFCGYISFLFTSAPLLLKLINVAYIVIAWLKYVEFSKWLGKKVRQVEASYDRFSMSGDESTQQARFVLAKMLVDAEFSIQAQAYYKLNAVELQQVLRGLVGFTDQPVFSQPVNTSVQSVKKDSAPRNDYYDWHNA